MRRENTSRGHEHFSESPATSPSTVDSSSTLSYLRYRGLSSHSKRRVWFDYYFNESEEDLENSEYSDEDETQGSQRTEISSSCALSDF